MSEVNQRVPSPRQPVGKPVLAVAVDGSAGSVRGLVWALRRAVREDWDVEIVTVWPVHGAVFTSAVPGHFCEPRWFAGEVQEIALARAKTVVTEWPSYERRLENGDVLDVLVATSGRVVAVVVGTDRGPDTAIEPDPTALGDRLKLRAGCPVVLISGSAPAGVDPVPEPAIPLPPEVVPPAQQAAAEQTSAAPDPQASTQRLAPTAVRTCPGARIRT